jgi:enoyl-[acyl-carrier protein] reductase II
VVANKYTQYWEEHREDLAPFPMQFMKSYEDGANHLHNGDEVDPAEVDPEKEFWPAGQGVGAIDELVPAAEIVHSMVSEAEAILGRLSTLASA